MTSTFWKFTNTRLAAHILIFWNVLYDIVFAHEEGKVQTKKKIFKTFNFIWILQKSKAVFVFPYRVMFIHNFQMNVQHTSIVNLPS